MGKNTVTNDRLRLNILNISSSEKSLWNFLRQLEKWANDVTGQ